MDCRDSRTSCAHRSRVWRTVARGSVACVQSTGTLCSTPVSGALGEAGLAEGWWVGSWTT